jgi:hypothetical protein
MHKSQASLVFVAPRRRSNRNKIEEKFRLELEAEILVVAFRYRTPNGQQIYISLELPKQFLHPNDAPMN